MAAGGLVMLMLLAAANPVTGKRSSQVNENAHHSSSHNQLKLDVHFGSAESHDPKKNQEGSPPPFKLFQWNILADGLSVDGFCIPPRGHPVDAIPMRKTGGKSETLEELVAPVAKDPIQEMGNSTMAEFIKDVMAFAGNMAKPMGKSLQKDIEALDPKCVKDYELKEGEKKCCYDKKVQFKAVGECMQEVTRKSPVYTPGPKVAGETAITGNYHVVPAPNLTDPHDWCSKFLAKKKVLESCGDKNKAAVKSALNKTMVSWVQAIERSNRKWGLKWIEAKTKEALDWGSNACEEEGNATACLVEKIDEPKADGRGMRLLQTIKSGSPDIVTLQELDHYRFMQNQLAPNYSSSLEDGLMYEFRRDGQNSLKDTSIVNRGEAKVDDPESKLHKFAFLPKMSSNAVMVHTQKYKATQTEPAGMFNDNDGSAIFWKKSRFTALNITKHLFPPVKGTPGKDGGVVAVLLHDQQASCQFLWAVSTHLASGDTAADEQERISLVRGAASFVKGLQTKAEAEEAVKKCKNASNVEIVLGMDGNSNMDFDIHDKGIKIEAENNMYHTLIKEWGLHNFKVEPPNVGKFGEYEEVTVSVDKMRGVGTAQPWKMGEYQLDLIDYISFSKGLHEVEGPKLKRYKVNSNTLQGPEREQVLQDILPTYDNPSDHLPILMTIGYRGGQNLGL